MEVEEKKKKKILKYLETQIQHKHIGLRFKKINTNPNLKNTHPNCRVSFAFISNNLNDFQCFGSIECIPNPTNPTQTQIEILEKVQKNKYYKHKSKPKSKKHNVMEKNK